MSYQVAGSCYGTVPDAGAAACAAFAPVTQVSDAFVRTVSCGSAAVDSGALNLTVTTTPVDGQPSTVAIVQQQIAFPVCQQQDQIDAYLYLFGAALAAAAAIFPLWMLYRWITTQTRAEVA